MDQPERDVWHNQLQLQLENCRPSSKKFSKKSGNFKSWTRSDKKSEMGPLVTKEHLEKVKSYVDIGVKGQN